MPKHKTPMQIMYEVMLKNEEKCFELGLPEAGGYQSARILAEFLLPAERKMVEDAIIDNADIRYDHFGQEKEQASTYFTNKYGE